MGDTAGKTTIAQLIVRKLRKVSFRCDTPEPGVLTVADRELSRVRPQIQVSSRAAQGHCRAMFAPGPKGLLNGGFRRLPRRLLLADPRPLKQRLDPTPHAFDLGDTGPGKLRTQHQTKVRLRRSEAEVSARHVIHRWRPNQ
jgi:hypothetical protein